jgi:hypothetical protein
MSRTAGQPTSLPSSYKVVWFPPDRPVEGNTIYIRPDVDCDPQRSRDVATRNDTDG